MPTMLKEIPTPNPQASLKGWRLFTAVLMLAPWVVMAVLIAMSPPRLLHDERYQIGLAALAEKEGLVAALVSPANPSAVGALHAMIHTFFSPVTALEAPAVRWLNFLLAMAIAVCAAVAAHSKKSGEFLAAGFAMLSVPFIWPCIGLALTEIPAFAAFAVGTVLFSFLKPVGSNSQNCLLAFLGGLAWGVAIIGRQNYLVLLPCLAVWGIMFRQCRRVALFGLLGCLLTSSWLFVLWSGLLPPSHVGKIDPAGVEFQHVVFAAMLIGFAGFVVAPNFLRHCSRKVWIVSLLCSALLNLLLASHASVPARGLLSQLVGSAALHILAWPIMTCLLAVALTWLYIAGGSVARSSDLFIKLNGIVIVGFLVLPAKIPHVFSSRYVACVILPLLLISKAERESERSLSLLVKVLGILVGAGTLYSYYVLN